jgi:hypothetical protein
MRRVCHAFEEETNEDVELSLEEPDVQDAPQCGGIRDGHRRRAEESRADIVAWARQESEAHHRNERQRNEVRRAAPPVPSTGPPTASTQSSSRRWHTSSAAPEAASQSCTWASRNTSLRISCLSSITIMHTGRLRIPAALIVEPGPCTKIKGKPTGSPRTHRYGRRERTGQRRRLSAL